MDEFLRQYGLLALYFGMWIEGETVLVIAGFLAHQHSFPLWTAYPVAAAGALSVDQAIYLLGRFSGRLKFVQKLHVDESGAVSWRTRLGESWLAFFVVRFIYGTRTPFMFFVGSRRLPWLRFLLLEIPAVAVWCAVWLFFGNLLSNVLVALVGHLRGHHRAIIVVALAALGLCTVSLLALRKRRRRAGPRPGGERAIRTIDPL